MKKIENAERPMSAIVSSPAQRGPCACPADTFQFGDQFVNEAHPAEESTFESRRKREPQHAAGESEENHNLWHFRLSQVRTRPMADIFESVARINYKCDSFAFRTAERCGIMVCSDSDPRDMRSRCFSVNPHPPAPPVPRPSPAWSESAAGMVRLPARVRPAPAPSRPRLRRRTCVPGTVPCRSV